MHKVTHLSRELKSLSRYNIKKNKKSSYLHIQNKNLLSNLLSERMEDLHPDQRACSSIIQCVRTSRRISKTLRFLKRKSERILHSIIYFKQQQLPFPKKKVSQCHLVVRLQIAVSRREATVAFKCQKLYLVRYSVDGGLRVRGPAPCVDIKD